MNAAAITIPTQPAGNVSNAAPPAGGTNSSGGAAEAHTFSDANSESAGGPQGFGRLLSDAMTASQPSEPDPSAPAECEIDTGPSSDNEPDPYSAEAAISMAMQAGLQVLAQSAVPILENEQLGLHDAEPAASPAPIESAARNAVVSMGQASAVASEDLALADPEDVRGVHVAPLGAESEPLPEGSDIRPETQRQSIQASSAESNPEFEAALRTIETRSHGGARAEASHSAANSDAMGTEASGATIQASYAETADAIPIESRQAVTIGSAGKKELPESSEKPEGFAGASFVLESSRSMESAAPGKIEETNNASSVFASTEIPRIAESVRTGISQHVNSMEIQLKPEGLGIIRLKLSSAVGAAGETNDLRLEIRAATTEAHALLQQHLGELKAALGTWDIRLSPAPQPAAHHVTMGEGDQGRFESADGRQPKGQHRQEPKPREKDRDAFERWMNADAV